MNNPGESSSVTHVRSGLMKALINHSSTIEKLCVHMDAKDMSFHPYLSVGLSRLDSRGQCLLYEHDGERMATTLYHLIQKKSH